jgi:hypothetical protein
MENAVDKVSDRTAQNGGKPESAPEPFSVPEQNKNQYDSGKKRNSGKQPSLAFQYAERGAAVLDMGKSNDPWNQHQIFI